MASRRNSSRHEARLVRDLQALLGSDRVMYGRTDLATYAYDGQHIQVMPTVAVHPLSTAEVAAVVRIAADAGVPVVPRGAGSGMTGGAVPEFGGIVLCLERMNRIIRISTEDRRGFVEPGVITGDFQRRVAASGLFYPPEPASADFSSLGGNIAESAGGLGCVKYGLTKDFVDGLEFVAANGSVVRTGVLAGLDAPFNVGALMVGCEGTLGIVTQAALRLIPRPESRATLLALFPTLMAAAETSAAILAGGATPSVLEFMDSRCVETVRSYVKLSLPPDAGSALLVELDGTAQEVDEGFRRISDIVERAKPRHVSGARTEEERASLWKLRKSLSPAIARIAPLKFNEDISVPLSKIPRMCAYVEELARRRNVRVVVFGHSGDGNLHVNFMTSPDHPDEVARVKAAIADLFSETVRLGGALSGEHGIGIAKREYIPIAFDQATRAFHQAVKRAFDPNHVLNPGKIFPSGGAE